MDETDPPTDLAARLRAAERSLAESRARQQAIADHTYDLILEIDPERRIVDVSAGCRRILGIEPEALIGRDGLEVVHPQDRETALEALRESVASDRSAPRVVRVVRPDGEVRWTEGVAASYRGAAGAVRSLVCCHDTTERVRQEEALQESEEHLARVFQASPAAMLVTRLEDGCVLDVNQAFLTMIGCEREEVLGTSPTARRMWAHPEERDAVICRLRREGSVRAFPSAFRDRKGRLRHGLVSAGVMEHRGEKRVVWQSIDVTDRRAAEEALRASEARYRSLMEHSPLGVVVLDPELTVLHANTAVADLVGAPSAGDLIGRDLRALAMYAVPEIREAVRGALVDGERSAAEVVHTSRWGLTMELLVRVAPFRDWDGTIQGVQAILEDVSQRNRLERGLREAQKMEAVGELASGVAHEFGNYLCAITTYADLIGRASGEGEVSRRAQKIMETAAEGTALVAQLQRLTNGGSETNGIVDLNASLRGLDDLIRSLADDEIRVSMRLLPVPVCVRIGPTQLDRIVLNLVLNGRDSMPEGGTLTLATSTVHVPGASDEGLCLPEGDYAVLSVQDTGRGMDATTKARVFDAFFTTKPKGQGTGLGLTMVQRTLRATGGDVKVTSSPDQGATFEVFLPLVPAPTSSVTEPADPRVTEPADPRVTEPADPRESRSEPGSSSF